MLDFSIRVYGKPGGVHAYKENDKEKTDMKHGMKKGGKGMVNPYPEKLKPGYPKGTEGVAKTVASPNYPRSNKG